MSNLLHAPHNSLKGKTIESLKSNGRFKGYILTLTDGIKVEITSSSISEDVYISKI